MHGRQVTKKDLALLMMDISPETDFNEAIETVNQMLNQHPDGDTQRVRQLLEFEMLDALMESEVRSEEDMLIESIVNLSRLGDDFPYESLPENLAEKAKARRSFEDQFAAESELDADNYAGEYMVRADVSRIRNSSRRLSEMWAAPETHDEWWKSRLSVVASELDELADYLEDIYYDIQADVQQQIEDSYRERYEASQNTLSKTSCCCGATESNPCACMKAPEPMKCSAVEPMCPCYAALADRKSAESFRIPRGHKLMTKELAAKIPELYSQENVADPIVVAHYFSPYGSADWFVLEWDGEDLMFGLADLGYAELGYWSLSELESLRAGRGKNLPAVERDLYWTPVPLSEVRATMGAEATAQKQNKPVPDTSFKSRWTGRNLLS